VFLEKPHDACFALKLLYMLAPSVNKQKAKVVCLSLHSRFSCLARQLPRHIKNLSTGDLVVRQSLARAGSADNPNLTREFPEAKGSFAGEPPHHPIGHIFIRPLAAGLQPV
jgi:hypothetical protein